MPLVKFWRKNALLQRKVRSRGTAVPLLRTRGNPLKCSDYSEHLRPRGRVTAFRDLLTTAAGSRKPPVSRFPGGWVTHPFRASPSHHWHMHCPPASTCRSPSSVAPPSDAFVSQLDALTSRFVSTAVGVSPFKIAHTIDSTLCQVGEVLYIDRITFDYVPEDGSGCGFASAWNRTRGR